MLLGLRERDRGGRARTPWCVTGNVTVVAVVVAVAVAAAAVAVKFRVATVASVGKRPVTSRRRVTLGPGARARARDSRTSPLIERRAERERERGEKKRRCKGHGGASAAFSKPRMPPHDARVRGTVVVVAPSRLAPLRAASHRAVT